jgi:cold shock CspA family protein
VVTGKVLRFDQVRGYGFIAPNSGGEDVFLHVNDLLDEKHQVRPGTVVEFAVEDSDRGLKASEVRIVEQPSGSGRDRADHRPHRREERRTDDLDGDGMCDVLSAEEFAGELTEALLRSNPTLTGAQILAVRQELAAIAQKHGWVDN